MSNEALMKIAEAVTMLINVVKNDMQFLARKGGEVQGMVERMTFNKRGHYRASSYSRRWK